MGAGKKALKTFTKENKYVCKLDWPFVSGTTIWLLIDDLVSKGYAEHRDWFMAVDEIGIEFRFKDIMVAYHFARTFERVI